MHVGRIAKAIGLMSSVVSGGAIVATVVITVAIGTRADWVAWTPQWAPGIVMWLPAAGFALGLIALVAQRLAARRGRDLRRRVAGSALLLSVGAALFVDFISLPVWSRDIEAARLSAMLSNAKQLCRAALEYANDHDGRLPDANRWCDELTPYVRDPNVFRSPFVPTARCAFAFNSALSHVNADDVADAERVLMIFGSRRGWNAAASRDDLTFPRLREDAYANVVGFADGHAKFVLLPSGSNLDEFTEWTPRRRGAPD